MSAAKEESVAEDTAIIILESDGKETHEIIPNFGVHKLCLFLLNFTQVKLVLFHNIL